MKNNIDALVLGIDIGGTTTTFGFVNHNGEIIAKGEIETCKYSDLNKIFICSP